MTTTNLMNKYKLNRTKTEKKSSILSQIEDYKFDVIESNIDLFRKELNRQNAINSKLSDNTQNIIENCSIFVENNSDIINKQLQELKDLDTNLKEVILQNNQKEELNNELNELVNSQQCIQLADNMKEIRNTTESIMNFLEKQNIKGFHN